ncbi:MAG: cytochrome P450, partial [Pseudomonadota bacterium]|nr:cytochrome P450 [Pseudomonadota bacterium]
MTDLPTIEGRPRPAAAPIAPTPPFPPPRPHKLGLLRLLLTLWRNPLDAWARPYFEQMIVVDRSILGEMAVINAPEAIRRVLADNSENYRKDRLQRRVLGKAMRDGLLLAEDRRWREQRRAAAPAFALRGVTEFAPAMRSAIDDLIARWRGLGDGAVVDVAAEAARLTLDVLTRTIFADGLGDDREQVRRHMRTYFDSVGRIDALDLLGLPAFLPRSGRGRVRRAQVFFDAAVQRLLATRNDLLAADPASAPHDLLTLLLASRQNGCGLTDDEIRANLVTFIAAGHETTANALTWSLFLLTLAPEWREGVAAEADGGEPAALVATRAVVDEALRLYPPLVAL